MNGLAKVDDYCGKLHIGIVKINDLELVTEYNLGELPALVYYRHAIPILYEGESRTMIVLPRLTILAGDLRAEDDILEWLVQNRNSGDEEDVIEEVEFSTLQAMVTAVENIAVLFCESIQRKGMSNLNNFIFRQRQIGVNGEHPGEHGDH